MDDGNPSMAPAGASFKIETIENIGQKARGVVYIHDLDIDKYTLTDEQSGISCVRFSAISDRYDRPIFFGKIFEDYYKIRWQSDSTIEELAEAVHDFLITLAATSDALADETETTLTNDNGLKIVREDCDSDLFIPIEDLADGFWDSPIAFLHKHDVSDLSGLYFHTQFGEISFIVKDKDATSHYEMCFISHVDKIKPLSRLIEATHRVVFDNEEGLFPFLESALSNYESTFAAHFEPSLEL